MSTTWTPARYPAGHPEAGKIIPSDAEEQELQAVAAMDALPEAPRVTPPAGSRFAPIDAPAPPANAPAPPAPPAHVAPVAPGHRRPFAQAPTVRRGASRQQLQVAGGALALLAVFALVAALLGRQDAPTVARVAPTAPSTPWPTIATTAPTTAPLPPDAVPRAIVGWFDLQDPATAVAIEGGTRYRTVARGGARWLLIALDGGGQVWVLAEDLAVAVDPTLADMLPTRPPAPPAAAPAPAAAPPEQACRTLVEEREVFADGTPIGRYTARGCTQAELEANAAQLEAAIRAARPTPTSAPTARPADVRQ